MICERCHGTGKVIYSAPYIAPDIYTMTLLPCPDCIGGTAYCCDGETAANDAPADPETGDGDNT